MRKLIFISVLILSAMAAQSQKYIPQLQVDDVDVSRYFVWHGDTIDFTSLGDYDIYVKYTDEETVFATPEQVKDSVDAKKVIHDITLSGTGNASLELKVDTSVIQTKHNAETNFLQYQDSTVKYVTPTQMKEYVPEQTVFKITLPYASTVAGRVSAATAGVDYPAGWVLAAGSSAVDLDINHGLSRRTATVTVFAVDGTQEQMLMNTVAYNGIITPDDNNLRIQSLATIPKKIAIYIVFGQKVTQQD